VLLLSSSLCIIFNCKNYIYVSYPYIQAFLEQKLVEFDRMEGLNHFVLTDSDIAAVDDLGHIFKKYPHCHLALTFRNNKGQPLNSGFVAVRGTRDGITK
jgi:hypothetical protein